MNLKLISIVLLAAIASACISGNLNNGVNVRHYDGQLKKFNSISEIESFLKKNTESRNYYGGLGFGGMVGMRKAMPALTTSPTVYLESTATSQDSSAGSAIDFSTTNIQVEGVDEADIVKNDGKYIYVLSGSTVTIVDAYPPENAKILSTIEFDTEPQELYINGNRLVVLGNEYAHREYPVPMIEEITPIREAVPPVITIPKTFVRIYDISDRSKPVLVRNVTVDGNYFNSRMIDENVYVIATHPAYYHDVIMVPQIMYDGENKTPDVYYFDTPDYSYAFTTIASVDVLDEDEEVEGNVYLLGSSQNMYVSQGNIYITYQRIIPYPYLFEKLVDRVVKPLVPGDIFGDIRLIMESNKSIGEKEREIDSVLRGYIGNLTSDERDRFNRFSSEMTGELERDMAKETEKTIIHKIEIKDGKIEYRATGEVPGRVLNQFSMDEYEGYFRIATTTGHVSRSGGESSANHIYVLDGTLNITGALEDLAPGEKIYSARFMGKRGYLVTFKKVDPLFVVDLSTPENPRVLGKLKIPGYSDYLHPYDENHIIGIGKEAAEADGGNFAWYQGVKLALFDVSDVEKPKEISKYVIGDRGTDSYALQDHKAFLFSRARNLLVIPVLLAEIYEEKYPAGMPKWTYGEYVWQGAYVFDIDTESGIRLRGGVTHVEDDEGFEKSGYYYDSNYAVKRSLYMDDTLYTISDGMIKMNSLGDLKEINKVYLSGQENWR